MKKIVALTLAIITVLLFVGCQTPIFSGGTQQPKISRGTVKGDIYTNDYLGFEFVKPTSWVYCTDEEIAAAINLGADVLLGENFKDTLALNPTVYDMMVRDTFTGTNINVGYENLAKTLSTNITVEQYVAALKEQLKAVSSTMQVTFPEKHDTVKLGETEFTRLICSVSMSGQSMQQAYYLSKQGGYMTFIIVTITRGYQVVEIEAMFR